MLTILIEHDGVVFSSRSASEFLPDQYREELAMAASVLAPLRCPGHAEPTGTVHLSFAPVRAEVDEPCCSQLRGLVCGALGIKA